MIKRYPTVTLTMNSLMLIFIAIERPIYTMNQFNVLSTDIIILIDRFLFAISLHTFLYLGLLKFWLTYFELCYIKEVSINEWKVMQF